MKYEVSALVTISIHCVVEAESREQALEEAEAADMMSFCHQCASGGDDRMNEWRTSGELDGTPHEMKVEELE
jgi:hypothetical protein